ncbi:hypothetical protein Tco_0623184 [Tanacetum coccineum]
MPRRKFNALARHLQDIMMESLPKMVDERIKKILRNQVPLHVAQGIILEREKSQAEVAKMIVDAIQQEHENFLSKISLQVNDAITNNIPLQVDSSVRSYIPSAVRPSDQDDPHDDAHPEGENSAKRQKTSEHRMFVFGESSSSQDFESEPDDEVLPNEKVSKYLMDEMSQTVDEAKLRKVVDEMLRQQCTSGDEHQYHLDQMQNFLKCDIMWENRKEVIVPPYQPKPTPVAQSCQIDPKAPALSLVDDYAKTGLLWSLSVFIRSTVIWERVHDFQLGVESYQQQVNLTAPTITFPCIKKYKVFSIISEPIYGIIYKNSKKEKRVMRHQEVHKFCDATLKKVLEGLKSYNIDSLSHEDVEYLQLFEEAIEEWLKHHDQMRH